MGREEGRRLPDRIQRFGQAQAHLHETMQQPPVDRQLMRDAGRLQAPGEVDRVAQQRIEAGGIEEQRGQAGEVGLPRGAGADAGVGPGSPTLPRAHTSRRIAPFRPG